MRAMTVRFIAFVKFFGQEAVAMFRTSDTRLTECLLAVVTLAWVGVMMHPSWPKSSSAIYVIMNEWLPQWLWNAVFLSVGSVTLFAVVLNDLPLRRLCAFTGAGLFVYVSVAAWLSPVLSPAAVILPIYAAASVLAYWRVGELIRYEDTRRTVMASYRLPGKGAIHGAH